MWNLKNKKAIVAGGCGLIGKEVVSTLRDGGCEVLSVDIKEGADIWCNVYSNSGIEEITNRIRQGVDIWVDCTYLSSSDLRRYELLQGNVAVYMAEQNKGIMILLSSIYGLVGADDSLYEGEGVIKVPFSYSFQKGGVIALTKGIASRCGPYGVRCNCISPGGVSDNQDPKFVERYEKKVPLGRMATPQDIADAVLFLVSDKASYITGINLKVEGGITARI